MSIYLQSTDIGLVEATHFGSTPGLLNMIGGMAGYLDERTIIGRTLDCWATISWTSEQHRASWIYKRGRVSAGFVPCNNFLPFGICLVEAEDRAEVLGITWVLRLSDTGLHGFD